MATRLPTRAELDPEFTWDLSSLYSDHSAYHEDFATAEAQLERLAALQGR